MLNYMKESIVGMSFDKCEPVLKSLEIPYRIVERDGVGMMKTADVRPERINIVLENETIKETYMG